MKNVMEELLNELSLRVSLITDEYTDNQVDEFTESLWTKKEILAYDIGYIKALKIAVDIIREQSENKIVMNEEKMICKKCEKSEELKELIEYWTN